MRKVTFRTEEVKRDLVRRFLELKASGMSGGKAAEELGVAHSGVAGWANKYNDNQTPTVIIPQTRKPYTKREPSQKAVIIVTTLSNVAEVLKSL